MTIWALCEEHEPRIRRFMGSYRLYHKTVLIGVYQDPTDALREIHRSEAPPNWHEWSIIRGDECIIGTPPWACLADPMEDDE